MKPRERFLSALRRKVPDSVPKHIRFTPEYRELLVEKIGTTNYEEYFGLEVRRVGLKPYRGKLDFSKYYGDPPENACFDDWGLPFLQGTEYHKRLECYPMRNLRTV